MGPPLIGLGMPGPGRADAKQFPGLLLAAKHRLARKKLGAAGPGGAAALDRIGDPHIMASAQKKTLPAALTVGFGLPADPAHAAAVHEQQRVAGPRLLQLHILHIHLLDLEVAVGVYAHQRPAGRVTQLPHRQALQGGRTAADMGAA